MTISFIVTTYNIDPYVGQCLASLAGVTRPGDQVIIVDDGSDDRTVGIVKDFIAERGFGADVAVDPIFLGTNTIGGVGIGANIGMDAARCDTVFFVDGDDFIDPKGFTGARMHWEMNRTDILFTNYMEFDEQKQATKPPADAARWNALTPGLAIKDQRLQALPFIAVPWRKFYRRDFLIEHGLRFPEGDFFFEDNPFHWAVCLAAKSIGFINRITCYHRVNRPGQTMASTGAELTAFFTHFETIQAGLPAGSAAAPQRLAAAQWVLSNISWHLGRLSAAARPAYAAAAHKALAQIDAASWSELARTESGKQVWRVAQRLRAGEIEAQLDRWERQEMMDKLGQIERRSRAIENQLRQVRRAQVGLAAADTFAEIKRHREGI